MKLGPALEEADVSLSDLARYLQVSEEEAEAIIIGRSKATEVQQRIIAASLRRSMREVFSDQPPDPPAPVATSSKTPQATQAAQEGPSGPQPDPA